MASEQVERHLYNLRYDIYREATYSKKGNLIRPEKLLWHKTLKTWNTVFAICTEKIYNYNKKIIDPQETKSCGLSVISLHFFWCIYS